MNLAARLLGTTITTWGGSFEDLRNYLREFTNIGGDPAYDTNGILMLMLAAADNLREHDVPEELRELAETLTEEQTAFLARLAEWTREQHKMA